MIELSNEEVKEEKIVELVDSLFKRSGLNDKVAITFQDFQHLINEFQGDIKFESLDVEGLLYYCIPPQLFSLFDQHASDAGS